MRQMGGGTDVVEVWAHDPHSPIAAPWRCGSGYAVGGQLVLTAAHVVCSQDRPLTTVQVRALGGELLDSRVVWHQPVAKTDVALLAVADPRWTTPRRRVGFGRLVTGRPRQPFEAIGFPNVQASVRRRDTEQVSGVINPRTTTKAQRLALSVDDPAARVRRSNSPWAGISGAAVFCRGLLTAVVVEDPAGFDSHRLTAVPVSEFIGDPGFTALLAEHTGLPPRPEPVELRALAVAAPAVDSPPSLLRAELAPMPFRARPELDALLDWCRSELVWSVRLLVGPGGQGKTRLAHQLTQLVQDDGWASLVLADSAPLDALPVLGEVADPLLVVVDYAETRIAQLSELTHQLRHAEQPVRLLLLARTGNGWQAVAAAMSPHLAYLAGLPAHRLGPLEPSVEGRRAAWGQAATALAAALPNVPGHQHIDWVRLTGDLSAPTLDGPRYATILSIHLDALAAVLQTGIPLTHGHQRSAAAVVLLHETRYWATTATTRQLSLGPAAQRCAVAVATLWGADTPDEAQAVLAVTPGLQDLRAHERLEVGEWLATLYRDSGRYWSRLQPDRLAEHLVADVLGPGEVPTLAVATAAAATSRQMENALTVLTQAAVHHHHLTAQLTELITTYPVRAGAPALHVATRAEQPAPVLEALRQAVDQADLDTLHVLRDHLPYSSVALTELSWLISQHIVEHYRSLAEAAPDTHMPGLASSLNTLATRLIGAGYLQRALAPAQEAVAHYRRLAEEDPAAHLPNLAMSLTDLALALGWVRQGEQALAPAQEAVEHYRRLAEDTPGTHQPELAKALNTLAATLRSVGRREHALGLAEEAIGHYRRLAEEDPTTHLPNLATSLHSLARALVADREQALGLAQEAVSIRRRLAELNPDAHLPDLAASLYNLASALADVGRRQAAISPAKEAVEHYRRLAEATSDTHLYLPDLAASLYNLAIALADVGRRQAAISPAKEAVELYCQLETTFPDNFFVPSLADARRLAILLEETD